MTAKRFLSEKVGTSGKNRRWFQFVAVLTACILCFVSGLLNGWTSPSIPKLIANDSYIPMTFEQTSYFAVLHPLAMMAFCPLAALLMDLVGRKKLILYTSVPYLAACLLIGFARSSILLFLSRVLAGAADGCTWIVVPVYMAEITEKHVRGPIGCSIMINFYLGLVVINGIGYYLDIPSAAFICACFPVIHFLCFLPMPESPYWLIAKDRSEDAKELLQILRWRKDVDEEFAEIQKAVERQTSERGSVKDVLMVKSNRRALLIALLSRFAQQFAGMQAIFTYLQYIFMEAGGNIPGHISSMICMGLVCVTSFVASLLIEKFGRRPLILLSSMGCAIMLLAEAIFLYLKTIIDTSGVSWLPLAFMLIYIVVFSIGFCVVPTTLLGEIFPASIKGKAVTLTNIGFACFILLSAKVFQVLADHVDLYAPFLFFAVITCITTVAMYFVIIETKNRTLEEIQEELKKK